MDKPHQPPNSLHLPPTLRAERHGAVAVLKLARPEKRNALDDPTVRASRHSSPSIPDGIGAVVLDGDGDNFCAGLDLAELTERDVTRRHRAFALLASRLRADRVRQGAGRRRAARRGGRRRAGTCGGAPCARRRALGVLRAAGNQPRHLCRRRRLGAPAAADRHRAHDGHDAHRPHAQCRRRPGDRAHALSGRQRQGFCQGPRTCRTRSPAMRRSPTLP